MFLWIKTNLIWTQGRTIFIVACLLALIFWFLFKPLFFACCAFVVFSFYFFRNPYRINPAAISDDTILVCPCDGRVVDIQHDPHKLEGYSHKVSIFLSAFDVHVNWVPMTGAIEKIKYKAGAFKLAFLPKSSELNERNDLTIVGEKNRKIMVRQIAGLVARRIVCWVEEGEYVTVGQKYGMIKFGSRVDIFLPENVSLEVQKGRRVCGGETILGRWI